MNVISLLIPSLIFLLYRCTVVVAEVVNNKDYEQLKYFPRKTILLTSLVLSVISNFIYVVYGIKLDYYILFYSIGILSLMLIFLNLLNGGKIRVSFTVLFQIFITILMIKSCHNNCVANSLVYLCMFESVVAVISCIK